MSRLAEPSRALVSTATRSRGCLRELLSVVAPDFTGLDRSLSARDPRPVEGPAAMEGNAIHRLKSEACEFGEADWRSAPTLEFSKGDYYNNGAQ